MDEIVPEGVSLSVFLFVFTLRIDTLVFVKVLSVDFEVNPGTTIGTKQGDMFAMLYWKPLMITHLAFVFLHFAPLARQGYGGIGVYISVRCATVRTGDVL